VGRETFPGHLCSPTVPPCARVGNTSICKTVQCFGNMAEMKATSEELQVEVLELRKLADRLKKQAEDLAIRSAELEKLVQRTKRHSPETKPGR
jgi:hypothetical protein